jgi:hypothetical protein
LTAAESDVGLLRCSQPLVGVMGQTSKDDERMIQYLSSTSTNNGQSIIFDARPRLSAEGNHVRGGGYEKISNYQNVTITFLNIQNIHSVRESFVRLHGMFSKVQSNNHHQDMAIAHVELGLRSQTDKTTWLTHLVNILQGARRIASALYNGTTSLVHCSDGWDRTSQLTSLAILFLDPYYRTITGFQVLIEKEWLSFGHKFAVRSGVDTSSLKAREHYLDKQRSPVFVQFLDCVWQIKKQFSSYFEFNDNFLIACLRHVYSGRYGTFLFDTERERVEKKLKAKTISLWTEMNVHRSPFINDDYDPISTKTIESGCTMYTDLQVEIPLLSLWPAYEELWRQGVVGEVDPKKNKKTNKNKKKNIETDSDGNRSRSGTLEKGAPQLPPRRKKTTKVATPPPVIPKRLSFDNSETFLPPPTATVITSPPPRPKSKAPDETNNESSLMSSNTADASNASMVSSPPPRPKSKAPEAAIGEEKRYMDGGYDSSRSSVSSTISSIPERPSVLLNSKKETNTQDKRRSIIKRRDTSEDDVFDFA